MDQDVEPPATALGDLQLLPDLPPDIGTSQSCQTLPAAADEGYAATAASTATDGSVVAADSEATTGSVAATGDEQDAAVLAGVVGSHAAVTCSGEREVAVGIPEIPPASDPVVDDIVPAAAAAAAWQMISAAGTREGRCWYERRAAIRGLDELLCGGTLARESPLAGEIVAALERGTRDTKQAVQKAALQALRRHDGIGQGGGTMPRKLTSSRNPRHPVSVDAAWLGQDAVALEAGRRSVLAGTGLMSERNFKYDTSAYDFRAAVAAVLDVDQAQLQLLHQTDPGLSVPAVACRHPPQSLVGLTGGMLDDSLSPALFLPVPF